MIADAVQPIDSTFYYLYHFNGTSCTVVDSACETIDVSIPKFGIYLTTIDGSLYSAYNGIFKKEGNDWTLLFYDPYILTAGGSSKDNIFVVGNFGMIYHYNGIDWQKIVIHDDFQLPLCFAWTDGKEAFITSIDGYKTYMLHGK